MAGAETGATLGAAAVAAAPLGVPVVAVVVVARACPVVRLRADEHANAKRCRVAS